MTEQNEMYEQGTDEVTLKETKKPNLLNTKAGAVTLTLIGGMAIGALFFSMPQASAAKEKEPVPTTEVLASPEGDMMPESMMVKSDENGTQYSTDGGVTWTEEGTPPGTTVTEAPDGGQDMVTSMQGTPPLPGSSEGGALVKTSPDGTSEYSTDGRVTRNEGLLPGAVKVTNPDRSQTTTVTEPRVPAK